MSKWVRTSKSQRCPVCGSSDYCTVSVNGDVCKCCRVHEGASVRKHGEDGAGIYTIHKLSEPVAITNDAVHTFKLSHKRVEGIAKASYKSCNNLHALSKSIGISQESLKRMRVGYMTSQELKKVGTDCRGKGAWTIPMRSATNYVVGIRLRLQSGRKFSIKGGSNGLFIPANLDSSKPLLITEGSSDCLAALDMGFEAIGKPSNTSGHIEAAYFAKQRGFKWCIVVPDNDVHNEKAKKATELGLGRTIECLKSSGISVKVIRATKSKDLREYLRRGGKRSTIINEVRRALYE